MSTEKEMWTNCVKKKKKKKKVSACTALNTRNKPSR